MFSLTGSAPAPTFKSDEERREYEAGREAKRNGLGYLDNVHMRDGGSILLKTAWAYGFLSVEDPAERCEAVGANQV